ncbi:MAG: hypothetical protein LBH31_06570 [Burkholderiaceae bacterium]|jgi:uncharacterized membrane protein|nr:hypothetical protein [Burkholderiaceae bacterium]
MKNKFIFSFLLIAVVLLACGLRLHGLTSQSLWVDELFSADLILNRPVIPPAGTPWLQPLYLLNIGPNTSFWTMKAADQSPPLFELAGKLATTVFGDSEAALRLTSALASVILLLWLGWRAWRSRNGPFGMVYLTVFVLTAFSGLQIFYAQEVRAYALGTLFTGILAVLFWERIMAGWHSAPLLGWGEIALCIAACWTHYDALLLAGLLMVPYAREGWYRKNWMALVRMGMVAVAAALWLALSHRGFQLALHGGAGWVPKMRFGAMLQLVFKNFAQFALGYGLTAWLAVLLLVAIVLSLYKPPRNIKIIAAGHNSLRIGLTSTIAIGLTYMLLVSWMAYKSRIINVRHLIFILPVVYLMAGLSLTLLWQRWRWFGWAALIIMLPLQWPLIWFYMQPVKEDWRDASAFVTQRLHDGDLVLVSPMIDTEGASRYYLLRRSHKALQLRVIRETDASKVCSQIKALPHFGLVGVGAWLPFADALAKNCGAGWQIERTVVPNAFGQVWVRLHSNTNPSPP